MVDVYSLNVTIEILTDLSNYGYFIFDFKGGGRLERKKNINGSPTPSEFWSMQALPTGGTYFLYMLYSLWTIKFKECSLGDRATKICREMGRGSNDLCSTPSRLQMKNGIALMLSMLSC